MTYNRMESAAFRLGILSLICCSIIYFSLPAGAIAIILALLSRGDQMALGRRAKLALILGLAGILITLIAYTYVIASAYMEYGSWKALVNAYSDYTGFDYNDLRTALGF